MATEDRVNDFVIRIATVNGTGSTSANSLLMKAIFRMGIPVVGKNYFPSNIQGLPTWYEIRVTKDAYLSRSGHIDIMVAMNAQTYGEDLVSVQSGGVFIYDSTRRREELHTRTDVTVLPIPLSELANNAFTGARTRILMRNVTYVGALAALLEIDLNTLKQLLEETFSNKQALIDSNLTAIQIGYNYAREQFNCPLSMRLSRLDKTAGYIMIDGNTAAALGCVYAGATVGSWYPITPSTSLFDAFTDFCKRFRTDTESGTQNYCIIQAEDELAAIGMALGAAWNGARAFTSTSGPGISLMSEFLGLAYFTEIPLVLFDIQRVGPSTGMPTRTQQSDILAAAYASHGDTRHVLLFPSDPAECFEFSVKAFDLADRLQTPVIVLSDLDIGMNDWPCPELQWDDSYCPDYGKVYRANELRDLERFQRYLDVDGDGICYRSLPGDHPRGAYLIRGSGHNQAGAYTERSDEYIEVMDRLRRKFDTAATLVPGPIIERTPNADMAIVSLGSCHGAIQETRDRLAEKGLASDYMRIRSFPFCDDVRSFIDSHPRVFVVEQNRDAQLRSLLMTETGIAADRLVPVLYYGGEPLSSVDIIDVIAQDIKQGKAA
ncbi:MAG TPA: 2-oxoacid:acceptor oxidoreductase subunit alpha [Gammaproteobacteria bacterium]|nr:2-oxoacid:acceptor oxidoreductase subunit alpha [Gammaproteobacteria bacterium]|tara:strand:- start:857 stop:2668 length:1812 start_codon:yes stop_codon:yes gene_type:complete